MEDNYFHQNPNSITKIIATSGPFQIEIMEYVGTNDYATLLDISKSLVKEFSESVCTTSRP